MRDVLARNDLRSLQVKAIRRARWRLSAFRARKLDERTRIEKAIADLRRASEGVRSGEEAFDLASRFVSHGVKIWPWQVRIEIVALLRMLERDPPVRLVEIGAAEGGTLFLLTCVAADDAKVLSIDLPAGEFGGGYPASHARLYASFARDSQQVELIRADSHDPATAEKARSLFEGEPIDFLFIDGDHTYEGVRTDFDLYFPLVRDGGRIAFHDIVPGRSIDQTARFVGGVPRFWAELKESYDVLELVASWKQGGLGLGVLTKGIAR